MINNTPVSQIHIIQQHQAKHKRRLEKILQSRPPGRNQFTFSKNFMQMLETKKMNHEKWKDYHRSQERQQLTTKNEKMFNKLIDITIGEGPYGQGKALTGSKRLGNSREKSFDSLDESGKLRESQISVNSKRFRTTSLHHNYQLLNIRKSRMIDEENPKLAQRIMQKTGDLNHHKDLQQFRRTREIVCRLQKFHQLKRAMKNSRSKQFTFSQAKIRSRTLPAGDGIKTTKGGISAGKANRPIEKNEELGRGEQVKKQSNTAKCLRNKMEEDRRYRTMEQIGQQGENDGSQQLVGKAKVAQREQYLIEEQDQLVNRFLDADQKFAR